MDTYIIIKYKWQHGAYNLQDMIQFVENKTLSEQQFFEITRHYYNSVTKVQNFNK